MGEGSAIPTDPHRIPTYIQPSTQPQKTQKPRKPKRKDTQVPQPSDPIGSVADEAVYKELDDSGGPRCQETMGDTIAQTMFENVSKHSNDSLLARGNTLQSDEDRLKLDELMALCITLQNMVLELEKTKNSQHNEIASLKRRVKKLENKNRMHPNRGGLIDAIDADEEITLVSTAGDIVSTASAATTVSAATTTTATINTIDDITLARALEEMKSTKPKKKGIVIQELGESTTKISLQLPSHQS
ncbi:hypothetical protein Tco_0983398 [Tanacetum coccineum]